ncbi:hypothetical protein [Nonomuraea sp. NPDC049695]|uniref:hypothetical protein n=1 Tax=Nonomuraea sp. NPDC049695 TaxID=3154734 RepID=UPI003448B4EE
MWIKDVDLETLARSFHLDLVIRTPCYLSEILDHNIDDEPTWFAEVNDWIGIVPGHADGERVRSVTEGGRQALGLPWTSTFAYARDGRTVVSFDPLSPENRKRCGVRHEALFDRAEMKGLRRWPVVAGRVKWEAA